MSNTVTHLADMVQPAAAAAAQGWTDSSIDLMSALQQAFTETPRP